MSRRLSGKRLCRLVGMDAVAVIDRKRDGNQGNDEDEDFRGEFQILKHKTLVGLPYYGTLKQKIRPISWS